MPFSCLGWGGHQSPSSVLDVGVLADLLQSVAGRDLADRSRLRSHHERFGRGALTVEVHAGEQVTVGDAGGGEEAVVTLDEVVDGEDAVEVVTLVGGLLPFAIVAGP